MSLSESLIRAANDAFDMLTKEEREGMTREEWVSDFLDAEGIADAR